MSASLRADRSRTPRRGATVRIGVIAATSLAVLLAPILESIAALPTTSTPVLELAGTIRTRPFAGSAISTRDAEGTAFVPSDGSLWLVGDNDRSAFEIDAYSGELEHVVERSAFQSAPRYGGGPAAGGDRSGDLESLAYDANSDVLYAFSGTCCTTSTMPTAFRLVRGTDGRFLVDSWQPLPAGADYTAAAWSGAEDRIYVGKGRYLQTYDFETNTSGPRFRIPGLSGYLGLDFSADGADLLVVTSAERLFRVTWASKRITTGWDLDLTPFGVRDSRGVSVIPNPDPALPDRLYVYDGYDARPSNDPLKYALFIFDVTDGGGGGELVGNPGFETDTSGWRGSGVATLTRVAGGHAGSWAARLANGTASTGNCMLNDSPNWVGTTVAGTYTASLWVRADTEGATLRLRLREYDSGALVGTPAISQVTLTTNWQQVTVGIVPQVPGTSSLDLTAYVSGAPPGTCFDADDASITVSTP